jgi:uncharacterized protein YegP (UPF0339 family)
MTHSLEMYRDRKRDFRWRLRARNGKIVAESGEGYKRIRSLLKSYYSIAKAFRVNSIDRKDLTCL